MEERWYACRHTARGASWPSIISSPITVDDTIFFISPNSVALGTFDLWKSDGTVTGTQPVFQQIQPLSGTNARGPKPSLSPPIPGPPAASLVDIDGTLFFSIRDNSTTFGLWKSDGTTAGTIKVKGYWSNFDDSCRQSSFFLCLRLWFWRRSYARLGAVEERWHHRRHCACQRYCPRRWQ